MKFMSSQNKEFRNGKDLRGLEEEVYTVVRALSSAYDLILRLGFS